MVNPDIDSIIAALALVRQFLLPRDNIFRTATEIYMRHVGDERKRIWVNEEYRRFDSFLESSPSYFTTELTGRIKGLTNRELIEIFIYGSGLFHRASNQNMEDRLMDLYMNCPREPLVFAFHSSCIEMLRAPFAVSPVIYQDLAYWIHSGWCPRPTRMVISRLFANT